MEQQPLIVSSFNASSSPISSGTLVKVLHSSSLINSKLDNFPISLGREDKFEQHSSFNDVSFPRRPIDGGSEVSGGSDSSSFSSLSDRRGSLVDEEVPRMKTDLRPSNCSAFESSQEGHLGSRSHLK